MSKNKIKVGDVFKTNTGECTVVEYHDARNIIVEFNDKNMYQCRTEAVQLRRGTVKNVFHRNVGGVGYLGEGKYNSKTEGYRDWLIAIKNGLISKESELSNLQNFIAWYNKHKKSGVDWVFNTSLLEGSEDVCLGFCLLPKEIHDTVTFYPKKGASMKGVYVSPHLTKRYSAKMKCKGVFKYLGSFDTEIEAHKAYTFAKGVYVKELALKYKDVLPKHLFNKLIEWKVSE